MKKGFIFDLDGTIYVDDELIQEADKAISFLKERGNQVIFLTNKSIASRREYVKKLTDLGISVGLNEVINSNYITAKYLKDNMKPNEVAYVIGEDPLFEELEEEGILTTENAEKASFVVLGWDRQFTYDKINKAFQAWKNGAKIIATNPDRTCPVKGGEIPDCAAMIGALEGVTGEPISMVTGKPSSLMSDYVIQEVLKLEPSQCYMVGDRLETDIKMANEADMNSVLVLTGITNRKMLESTSHVPTIVLDSVVDLIKL